MKKEWKHLLGEPRQFLGQVQKLAEEWQHRAHAAGCSIPLIRDFVKSRNYDISGDPQVFREVVAAFVCAMRDYYAQDVDVVGVFKKRLEVKGPGYRGELIDLFYRCVFEGLDITVEGEALSRP